MSTPKTYEIEFTIDELREAGVHVEDEEAVERWAETTVVDWAKRGLVDDRYESEWDSRDVSIHSVWASGGDFEWDLLTDEEKNRVPREYWPE